MHCERRLKLPGRRDEGDCLRSLSSIGAGDSRYRSGRSPPILSASFVSSLPAPSMTPLVGGEVREERGERLVHSSRALPRSIPAERDDAHRSRPPRIRRKANPPSPSSSHCRLLSSQGGFLQSFLAFVDLNRTAFCPSSGLFYQFLLKLSHLERLSKGL